MSRRSSRASSVAAARRISDAAKDDGDDAPSENESIPEKPGALKGAEKANGGDAAEKATKKKAAPKKKKKAPPKKRAAIEKGKTKSVSDDEDGSEPEPKKKAAPKKRKSKSFSDDESSTKKKAAPKKRKSKSSSDDESSAKKKAAPKKRKSKGSSDDESSAKKRAAPKKRKSKSPSDDEVSTTVIKTKSPKKKKAADHQRWTERTPLTRHWDPEEAMASTGSYTFTVISWNVAGLRAFVKKRPDALRDLAAKYQADVICLQETKLQEGHLDDPKLKLREHFEEKLGGYEGHWSYSLEKKGYSGTAMFIKKRRSDGGAGAGAKAKDGKKGKKQATLGAFFGSSKAAEGENDASTEEGDGASTGDVPISHLAPIKVDTELGLPAHDGEGRTITAEFPLFYLTNVYVPNSGQKLDRLGYRTEQWDADLLERMQRLEKDGNKPVIWLGDLNVAHNEKDTWNEGAKHLAKSAGTTPEERASFERQLGAGYVDAFRRLHPEGRGHYSYWSQRAGNREPNKGLRLDYFVCSEGLMEDGDGRRARVRDSYMVPEELGSDHCPIVLEIEIKR